VLLLAQLLLGSGLVLTLINTVTMRCPYVSLALFTVMHVTCTLSSELGLF
jgi:hypothetical protein